MSTKVDPGMRSLLDDAAAQRGICRAELLRRALDALEASERGGLHCPACAEELDLV